MAEEPENQTQPGDARMSFGDHLEELRTRVFKAILSSIVVFVGVIVFHEDVMRIVVAPYAAVALDLKMNTTLTQFGVTQGFFAYMKVCIIAALILAAPAWIYQFWRFVGVGLYPHERKWVFRFAPLMIGLFVAGVSFGYNVLIPVGLRYLLNFRDPTIIQNVIGLKEYLDFFILLTLVLGITFQLPVGMALFSRLQLLGVQAFREKRRYFILVAFVAGALLTPPDVITQILLATPLVFLYEFGIFLAWLAQTEREPVRWGVWRKRAIYAGIVVAAIVVFRGRMQDSYHARTVGNAFRVETVDSDNVQYWDLFELSEQIHFEIEFAYRISEDQTTALLGIAGRGGEAQLMRFNFSDARVTVTSKEARRTRFLLAKASQSVDLERVAELSGGDFVEKLLEDIRVADIGDAMRLERLITGLVGERPAGAADLTEDSDAVAVEATLEAWLAWWRDHADWTYRGNE